MYLDAHLQAFATNPDADLRKPPEKHDACVRSLGTGHRVSCPKQHALLIVSTETRHYWYGSQSGMPWRNSTSKTWSLCRFRWTVTDDRLGLYSSCEAIKDCPRDDAHDKELLLSSSPISLIFLCSCQCRISDSWREDDNIEPAVPLIPAHWAILKIGASLVDEVLWRRQVASPSMKKNACLHNAGRFSGIRRLALDLETRKKNVRGESTLTLRSSTC